MNIPFIKIHNAGNDYLYIEKKSIAGRRIPESSLSKKICDRRTGVGADGVFLVEKLSPRSAFVKMRNSDGSSMEFCGNGVRGTSLYLRDFYGSRSRSFSILTSQDEYDVELTRAGRGWQASRLRIGNPSFESSVIGYSRRAKNCLGIAIEGVGNTWTGYCVAMPNPHAVILVDNFGFEWQKEGAAIENSRLFKNRINVMFTRVNSGKSLTVKPWERGAGATLSCGSGAAAAAVVSGLLGYTKGKITVQMPGGVLKTEWKITENAVFQEGPSEVVCSGIYRY